MFHSEILTSKNFNRNKFWSPGLENNHTLKYCLGNLATLLYMLWLLDKYQINIWMYGYSQTQGTRLKKKGELWDKSVPHFQQVSGPWPMDWRITIHSNGILVFFQQSWHISLCWTNVRTMYGYSPIQGTTFYSRWNFMKPGSQSGTYGLKIMSRNTLSAPQPDSAS